MNSDERDESSKKIYLAIAGAVVFITIASLLFIGGELERITFRWLFASIAMGAFCGIILNKRSLKKISGLYLLLTEIISVVMIVLTRDYWQHVCFGDLTPPMFLLSAPLTALVVYLITALIIFIAKSIRNRKQKSEIDQGLEIQD